MVNAVPYMYNTEKVAAADMPNSALDFLKPQFKGKIVTAYPADDDVTLWVFYHIVQKYGWSYMDKYMAAKPNFIQGHLGEQRSIGSGQNLVTFNSIYNITAILKKQGMTVESHFPTVDATPIWPLTGAIFKDAPHPNAAKLFLTWLLEPAQQIATGTWSGRSDVPPPTGYKPIFSYKVANDYQAFLTNQSRSPNCASASRNIPDPSSIPAACDKPTRAPPAEVHSAATAASGSWRACAPRRSPARQESDRPARAPNRRCSSTATRSRPPSPSLVKSMASTWSSVE